MVQSIGIDLIFGTNNILSEDEMFDMHLRYMPSGPLWEAFSIPGKYKYILLRAIIHGLYQDYLTKLEFLRNLNFATATSEGLEAWEEICSLEKKEFSLAQRIINVAINIGITRNITTIQQLASFISNTLGLSYIRWRYAGDGTQGSLGYDYNFDLIRDFGGYGRRQGIIWTLDKNLVQNNKDLKYFLDKISIQTQVNFYEDEDGRELLISY